MRILMLDDHPLILDALETRLKGFNPTIETVAATTPDEAIQALEAGPEFDLAFIDLNLGEGLSGFTVLRALRDRWPDVSVTVMSGTDRLADVVRGMDMGAVGFVPKRIERDELERALGMVVSGGIYIPRQLLELIQRVEETGDLGDTTIGAAAARLAAADAAARERAERLAAAGVAGTESEEPLAPDAPGLEIDEVIAEFGLTPRQTDVLALLQKALPNKLIARELNLSVETVKDHVAAILRAVNVSSRTQVVLEVNRRLGERRRRSTGA